MLEDLLTRNNKSENKLEKKTYRLKYTAEENCFRDMSEGKWVLANGVRYPTEERQVFPGAWSVEKETFVHEGSEWATIKNITVEEAMAIRDVERERKYRVAGSGEVVDYDDDGPVKWCKLTNLLYKELEQDETPEKDSSGKVVSWYSERINGHCVGKMVRDGEPGAFYWVPEHKASWNLTTEEREEAAAEAADGARGE